ncbi:MAG: high-potential iron-sulfur protein [Sulfuriferula sp.]
MINLLNRKNVSRRTFLKTATLLASIAAIPVAVMSKEAFAAKMAKASMQYQDHPKDNLDCSKCTQYIPGKSAKADGTCKLIDGAISPNGWCLAFAPKG